MALANQQALFQALANISNQIRDITANPKPSYSVDGRGISWGEHFNNLVSQMKEIRSQIQQEDSAFEVTSFGR